MVGNVISGQQRWLWSATLSIVSNARLCGWQLGPDEVSFNWCRQSMVAVTQAVTSQVVMYSWGHQNVNTPANNARTHSRARAGHVHTHALSLDTYTRTRDVTTSRFGDPMPLKILIERVSTIFLLIDSFLLFFINNEATTLNMVELNNPVDLRKSNP